MGIPIPPENERTGIFGLANVQSFFADTWRMKIRVYIQGICRVPLWVMVFGLLLPSALWAQLRLDPQDIRIDQSTEGGYVLRVRAEGIGSVLLTESTADPSWEEASYAFRNPDYHPMNGDERRILDGEYLPGGPGNYFIIDSTPEADPDFGMAYRLFIPYIINYGYPWTRNGEVQVLDGTYLSIRTFREPFADYTGGFQDNPFILRVVQLPPPPEPPFIPPPVPSPEPDPVPIQEVPVELDLSDFMDATVTTFTAMARETRARVLPANHSEQLPFLIDDIMKGLSGTTLDLVIVLDTTQSMTHSLNVVRKELVQTLEPYEEHFDELRVGFLVYRDYFDDYLTRPYPMQDSVGGIQNYLDRSRAAGGRDIPEAVYEALYSALTYYDWISETREIILIGDAPPHPRPRGNITEDLVYEAAQELGVRINTIMLPHP